MPSYSWLFMKPDLYVWSPMHIYVADVQLTLKFATSMANMHRHVAASTNWKLAYKHGWSEGCHSCRLWSSKDVVFSQREPPLVLRSGLVSSPAVPKSPVVGNIPWGVCVCIHKCRARAQP